MQVREETLARLRRICDPLANQGPERRKAHRLRAQDQAMFYMSAVLVVLPTKATTTKIASLLKLKKLSILC